MEHFEFDLTTSGGSKLYGHGWLPSADAYSGSVGVICLVHGLGEHSGRYGYLVRRFTSRGLAVITIDLRGHGKSPGKRGHYPSYKAIIEDISLLLEEAGNRFGGLPIFLYGHSFGGNLVLYHGLRVRPDVVGYIATGPWLELEIDLPFYAPLLIGVMDRIGPSFIF